MSEERKEGQVHTLKKQRVISPVDGVCVSCGETPVIYFMENTTKDPRKI